jgi:deoxyribodipyrimidine photo-lyase
MSWPANRSAGLSRLEDWVPRAGRAYQARRNYDCGPGDRQNVSGLSPYIRHRLVDEREVLEAVLAAHAHSAADKFVQEVFWRTYWKGWLEHHPQAWARYRTELEAVLETLSLDASTSERYGRAVAGETGMEPFDGWVEELTANGYLHNHARMWFASIWVHTLGLPWVLGADFFMRHLLDGDPASNTLSWRWVVGLHTAGKTYLARPDNITRYTEGRLQNISGLVGAAHALQEAELARETLRLPGFCLPSGARLGLLLTDEDLSLPELPTNPVAIKGVSLTRMRSPLGVSGAVRAFADDAIQDALGRASERYGCAAVGEIGAEDQEGVLAWVREQSLDGVLVNYPTVGPARQFLEALAAPLGDAHVGSFPLVSEYDRLCWPHADRGYFKLRKRIPELLGALDIAAG